MEDFASQAVKYRSGKGSHVFSGALNGEYPIGELYRVK